MQLFLAAAICNKDHSAANTLDNFCRTNKPMFRVHFSDGFSVHRLPNFRAHFSDDFSTNQSPQSAFSDDFSQPSVRQTDSRFGAENDANTTYIMW